MEGRANVGVHIVGAWFVNQEVQEHREGAVLMGELERKKATERIKKIHSVWSTLDNA